MNTQRGAHRRLSWWTWWACLLTWSVAVPAVAKPARALVVTDIARRPVPWPAPETWDLPADLTDAIAKFREDAGRSLDGARAGATLLPQLRTLAQRPAACVVWADLELTYATDQFRAATTAADADPRRSLRASPDVAHVLAATARGMQARPAPALARSLQYLRGLALLETAQIGEAVRAFRRALPGAPEPLRSELHLRVGNLLASTSPRAALRAWQSVRDPAFAAEAGVRRVLVLADAGKCAAALRLAREVATLPHLPLDVRDDLPTSLGRCPGADRL